MHSICSSHFSSAPSSRPLPPSRSFLSDHTGLFFFLARHRRAMNLLPPRSFGSVSASRRAASLTRALMRVFDRECSRIWRIWRKRWIPPRSPPRSVLILSLHASGEAKVSLCLSYRRLVCVASSGPSRLSARDCCWLVPPLFTENQHA